MLSFDIETEGLDPKKHRITVASVYDPHRNIQHTYNFLENEHDDQQVLMTINAFLKQLDDAPALCCFNGVKFDVPFIAKRFNVSPLRVNAWMLKLFDIFEVCRLVYGSSCSLNALLTANGKEVKSSSGLQAVEWARQKEWKLLEEYCMRDTVLTHEVSATSMMVELPLSSTAATGSKKMTGRMEHVYCPVSNEHKVLNFFWV
jgi:uncharacterized protein YprB with RNaseH-like and TPR domain